ncbi:MAG: hypothetical protein JWO94_3118 [Verrucomicrobiaceae bacterium]|nr:hypothetical protein [Verrucomicrobiaceae bacterium]
MKLPLILISALLSFPALAGETLYNGIVLPDAWPPKITALTREPLAVPPYLASPPPVIPIEGGRQLLVDDFLIEQTSLTRTHHLPVYHAGNPVLQPDKPWEGKGSSACTMAFSDGVWFDPADQLFKIWYQTHERPRATCYATSKDGIHWDKPALDVEPGTNVVLRDGADVFRDSNTVWLDLEEKDPLRRFKMFPVFVEEKTVDGKKQVRKWMKIYFSPDGIHWKLAVESDECGDRTTVFRNPFRKTWVFGLRGGTAVVGRCREYYESADLFEGARWGSKKAKLTRTLWIGADTLDPERHDLHLFDPIPSYDQVPVQLYNLDCVAYESLMVGLFTIWRGQPQDRAKPNEVCVGYSRDGFHWTRPDRRPFCPVSEKEGDWNWGNVQSTGGCCQIVGDQLYFFVSGRQGVKGTKADGRCTMSLATLRRDGFTSMDAGETEGSLTTRPLRFKGGHLFVNAAAAQGELRAEVLDEEGKVIEPFARANCKGIRHADGTKIELTWDGGDLSALAGRAIKLRFSLSDGSLYAFWITPDASGASHGYVGAGGPGFTGMVDMGR